MMVRILKKSNLSNHEWPHIIVFGKTQMLECNVWHFFVIRICKEEMKGFRANRCYVKDIRIECSLNLIPYLNEYNYREAEVSPGVASLILKKEEHVQVGFSCMCGVSP